MSFYSSAPLPRDRIAARFIELELNDDLVDIDNVIIRGRLEACALEDAAEYEALSYTWGKAEDGEADIQLNNQRFRVGSNLYAALRQLSLSPSHTTTSTRRLWIDAICINQTDDAEKSQQVMQMTEIYASASRVLVWLGEPDELSTFAFDTLTRFAQDDHTKDGSATYRDLLDTSIERKEAIRVLLQRPYFGRVWVIQEVVAARSAIVICGSISMELYDFSRAFNRMTGSGFYPHSHAVNVIGLGSWRTRFLKADSPERDDALDLQTLLMYSRDKGCQNTRDRVYALRGIGTNKFAEGVIVDYSQSVERVYINCAKHWLSIRPDLRVLSTIEPRHLSNTTLRLPSWVPDWSQPNHPSGVLQRYFRFLPERSFRAAGKTMARVTVCENSDAITLEGGRFDTIAAVIQITSLLGTANGTSCALTQTTFAEFAAGIASSNTYPYTGELFQNAVLRTLTADRTGLSFRVTDDYRSKYLTAYSNWRLCHDQSSFNLPDEAWSEISAAIGPIVDDKDMFVTTKGYIGLSRAGFGISDLVCVFLGGEVPFLVRKIDPLQEMFKFLGECYVHGIMDGEAMPDLDRAGRESFRLI